MKISNLTLPKSPITVSEVIEVYRNTNVLDSYGMTLHENGSNNGLVKSQFYKQAYECKQFAYCILITSNKSQSIDEIIY